MDRIWERFVALGDSFTEGLSDPDPVVPDRYVGWADRLAARLGQRNAARGRPFGYANLAIRGLTLAQVIETQLEAALDLTPDLVSFVAGGNDYLRVSVDQDAVADQLEEAIAQLRESGADVLVVTAPNLSEQPVVRAITGRMAVYNANLWGIAQRHGCFVVDIWSMRTLRDSAMWSPDRIHFSTEGHRRVAAQAALTLRIEGADETDWGRPYTPATRLTRIASLNANRAWAAEHLAPWVAARVRGRAAGAGIEPKRPLIEPVEPLEPTGPIGVDSPAPREPTDAG